jgi:hypothetical protein
MFYAYKMKSGDENNIAGDERASQLTTETLYSIGQAISSVWIPLVVLFLRIARRNIESHSGARAQQGLTQVKYGSGKWVRSLGVA